ncbi:MAG: hypothetical protein AAF684_09245, partial [Pseudomonadota bacterium]
DGVARKDRAAYDVAMTTAETANDSFEAHAHAAMAAFRHRRGREVDNAIAAAVLNAVPRYGPGMEMRSIAAAVARKSARPPGEIAWAVRTATLEMEAAWRLTRVRGATPTRWRRVDPVDRIDFEGGSCGARGTWPRL